MSTYDDMARDAGYTGDEASRLMPDPGTDLGKVDCGCWNYYQTKALNERLHVEVARLQHLDYENAGLTTKVEQLQGRLDDIAGAHADLRLIKSVRNTRHAMNLVTRIGKLARGEG